ncbi:MAG: GNAT family N-acetyltransferase [Sciscionella sp.]
MIDVEELRAAYDERMRRPPATPPVGARYERDGPVVRIVGQLGGFISTPRDTGVRGAELDELIARQRDHFAARGERVQWSVRAHDQPADLASRLRAAGFVSQAEETVFVGRVEDIDGSPVTPEGVVLRPATAYVDMHRIAAMESAVWGRDWTRLGEDLIARVAAAPEEISVLIAEAGGEVVSAAWLVFLGAATQSAGLWGGSTRQAWRGRGIYRALLAARARRARARGVRFLCADASADSAPILRRSGLHAVTTSTPYVWSPPGQ